MPSLAALRLLPPLAFLALLAWSIHLGDLKDKWRSNAEHCAEMRKLESSKKDEQKATTAERIKVVTRTIHDADERAKVVEKALPPGDCKTNAQVMGADL
jgi:hypothetical protein